MKKIVLTLFTLLFTSLSIHAQDVFFTDSLRKELKQYLLDKNILDTPYSELVVRNLISMESLKDNPRAGEDKFGIYDFYGESQIVAFRIILLKHDDNYEILNVLDKNYSQVRTELKAYFELHPEVPEELFPLYLHAIKRVRKKHSHLEKAFGIRMKRDKLNDSIYQYIHGGKPMSVESFW